MLNTQETTVPGGSETTRGESSISPKQTAKHEPSVCDCATRLAEIARANTALYEALKEAKETLKVWNELGLQDDVAKSVWDAYQESPEMKRINSALALANPITQLTEE